jgi:hypothetical protein
LKQVKTRDVCCANCGVNKSSEWRRNVAGEIVCNACGLYYKLHHVHRPISLKRNVIRRRSRYENGKSANASNARQAHASMAKSQTIQTHAQAQAILTHVATQARPPVPVQALSQPNVSMPVSAPAFGAHPSIVSQPSVRMHLFQQAPLMEYPAQQYML